jgi:tRNA (cmo5U34)-methyltransferase
MRSPASLAPGRRRAAAPFAKHADSLLVTKRRIPEWALATLFVGLPEHWPSRVLLRPPNVSKAYQVAASRGGIVDRVHRWKSTETATAWDEGGASQLPTRAEQQDALLALLVASEIGDGAVVDLGIGSGLVAEVVLEAMPEAQLVGVDSSEAMLDLARERLSRFGSRALLRVGDLSDANAIDLPRLRYKAAFSIQTMHHLGDLEKKAALAWAAELLDPNGLIVIIDRVKVEEPLFQDWLVVWRRLDPAQTTPGTYAEHLADLKKEGDRPALLEDHLGWMVSAGLHACCLHLYGNRAVLVGRKRP